MRVIRPCKLPCHLIDMYVEKYKISKQAYVSLWRKRKFKQLGKFWTKFPNDILWKSVQFFASFMRTDGRMDRGYFVLRSIDGWSYPITGLERPLGLQEFEAPRISRQSAYDGGKVTSPTHRPPLHPSRYPWRSFLLRVWVDHRLEYKHKYNLLVS
jgi:hypothetical protein